MSQLSRSGPEGREDLCRAAGLQLPAGLHRQPLKLMLTSLKECSSNSRGELVWRVKASGQEATFLSSMSFCLGCLQEVMPTFRVGLSISDKPVKNIPGRSAGALVLGDS